MPSIEQILKVELEKEKSREGLANLNKDAVLCAVKLEPSKRSQELQQILDTLHTIRMRKFLVNGKTLLDLLKVDFWGEVS